MIFVGTGRRYSPTSSDKVWKGLGTRYSCVSSLKNDRYVQPILRQVAGDVLSRFSTSNNYDPTEVFLVLTTSFKPVELQAELRRMKDASSETFASCSSW